MNNNMDLVDVSDNKFDDKFMKGIVISLIALVVLGLLAYFFGYNIVKGFIKV